MVPLCGILNPCTFKDRIFIGAINQLGSTLYHSKHSTYREQEPPTGETKKREKRRKKKRIEQSNKLIIEQMYQYIEAR